MIGFGSFAYHKKYHHGITWLLNCRKKDFFAGSKDVKFCKKVYFVISCILSKKNKWKPHEKSWTGNGRNCFFKKRSS